MKILNVTFNQARPYEHVYQIWCHLVPEKIFEVFPSDFHATLILYYQVKSF